MPTAPPVQPEAPGYRLERLLGSGGMGVVYAATELATGQPRALKFLHAHLARDPEYRHRFARECRFLLALDHPCVVRLHAAFPEAHQPYLVMDLCLDAQGRPFSLRQVQAEAPDQRLTPARLTEVLPPLLALLADFHRQGLIHRDLKPENVLLHELPDGRWLPRLADFGLVAAADPRLRERLARFEMSVSMQELSDDERALVGTYAYMSPEQKRGARLDARADVYSLGVMVYRLATGYERPSFELPREVVPELPAWVDELVRLSLEEDPARRAADAGVLLALLPPELQPTGPALNVPELALLAAETELAQTAAEPLTEALAPSPVAAAPATLSGVPAPAKARARSEPRSWIFALGLTLALGTVAVLGLALLLWWRRPPAPADPPAAVLAAPDPAWLAVADALAADDANAARQALMKLKGQPAGAPEAALPSLRLALAARDAGVRVLAWDLVAEWPALAVPLASAWEAGLRDPELAVRLAVLRGLARYPAPPLASLVQQRFDEGPPAERQLADERLQQLDPPAAPPYLSWHLHRGNLAGLSSQGALAAQVVRAALARGEAPAARHALALLPQLAPADLAGVLPDFLAWYSSPDAAQARLGAEVLAALGPLAVPGLMDRLRQQRGDARLRTAILLEEIGVQPTVAFAAYHLYKDHRDILAALGAEVLPELQAALASDDLLLQQHALQTLLELGRTGAPLAPALVEMLIRLRDDEARLREPTLSALLGLGADSVPLLVAALRGQVPPAEPGAPAPEAPGPAAAPHAPEGLLAGEALVLRRVALTLIATLAAFKEQASDAIPELLLVVAQGDRELAAAAAQALSAIGTEESYRYGPWWAWRLRHSAETATRQQAARVLVRHGDPVHYALLAEQAASPELPGAEALALIAALGEVFTAEPAAPLPGLDWAATIPARRHAAVTALRRLLGPGLPTERVSAALSALQAAGAGAAGAVPELQALLAAREPGLARQAALVLGGAGPPGLAILIEALRGEGAGRRLALEGLPAAGEQAVAPLRELLQDRRETVRNAVVQALGLLGERAAPASGDLVLLYRQGRASPVLILDTLGAIGGRAQAEAGGLAVGALDHAAIEVRQAAAAAIPRLGDLALNPLLAIILGRDSPTRRRAVALLPAMAPHCAPVLPIVASLAKDPEVEVRRAAVRTFGGVGPPAAPYAELLCQMLSEADSELRLAAADALGALGPAARDTALPCLDALLRTRPEVILRDRLEQARKRLVPAP